MDQLASNLPEALNRAVSDYQAGKLVEAEQLCEQIVAAKSDFFDALYLLAIVQMRLGKTTRRWRTSTAQSACSPAMPWPISIAAMPFSS
jgi:hypothetical protein